MNKCKVCNDGYNCIREEGYMCGDTDCYKCDYGVECETCHGTGCEPEPTKVQTVVRENGIYSHREGKPEPTKTVEPEQVKKLCVKCKNYPANLENSLPVEGAKCITYLTQGESCFEPLEHEPTKTKVCGHDRTDTCKITCDTYRESEQDDWAKELAKKCGKCGEINDNPHPDYYMGFCSKCSKELFGDKPEPTKTVEPKTATVESEIKRILKNNIETENDGGYYPPIDIDNVIIELENYVKQREQSLLARVRENIQTSFDIAIDRMEHNPEYGKASICECIDEINANLDKIESEEIKCQTTK